MPIKISQTAGGLMFLAVVMAGDEFTLQEAIDLEELSDDYVDEKGFLIPGTPLTKVASDGGLLIPITDAGQKLRGVVAYPIKVAEGNAAGNFTDAGSAEIVINAMGIINRGAAESNLGREYTSAELAAFATARHHVLTGDGLDDPT